ncbi:hypothetical protein DVH24_041360 [Malus domestica]|uniref:Uncharacterized protein n=1 Tax=Malus domestica TaxID=3750 RepID=A0A498IG28_MALDO|nr:hypothetical protein DVH24_041360 [Malus domestica]
MYIKRSSNKTSHEIKVTQIVSSCQHAYKLRLYCPTAGLPKELYNYPNLISHQAIIEELATNEILEKLPSLTTLRLNNTFKENTEVLAFPGGGFPRLEVLSFVNTSTITEWRVEECAFRSLHQLHISIFLKLKARSDGLRT